MSNNKIFQDIENLLKDIIQKNHYLKKEENNISQIDIDIIKNDIRNLYQLYHELSAVSGQQTTKEEERKANSEKGNKESNINKQQKVIIEEPKEKREAEAINIIPQKTIAEEQKTESKESAKVKSDLFTETDTLTISEKFRDDKKSINDTIGINKSDKNIADKLNTRHTDDIKASIGINEKFLFINELFDGNMQEYNEFIAKLNNQKNLEEAYSFINEEKLVKNWKDNLESLSKLTELIESRY